MTFYVAQNERPSYESFLTDVVRTAQDDDVVFFGGGRSVGVERKAMSMDLPMCVTRTHHHLDQLRRMRKSHHGVYLLIEGAHYVDDEGYITLAGRRVDPPLKYAVLIRHLETIKADLGVGVAFTRSFNETCAWLTAIKGWWEKTEHTSAAGRHQSFTPVGATLMQRVAEQLPGVGAKLAAELASHVPFPAAMNEVTESDLRKIDGFGRRRAKDVIAAWGGEGGQ